MPKRAHEDKAKHFEGSTFGNKMVGSKQIKSMLVALVCISVLMSWIRMQAFKPIALEEEGVPVVARSSHSFYFAEISGMKVPVKEMGLYLEYELGWTRRNQPHGTDFVIATEREMVSTTDETLVFVPALPNVFPMMKRYLAGYGCTFDQLNVGPLWFDFGGKNAKSECLCFQDALENIPPFQDHFWKTNNEVLSGKQVLKNMCSDGNAMDMKVTQVTENAVGAAATSLMLISNFHSTLEVYFYDHLTEHRTEMKKVQSLLIQFLQYYKTKRLARRKRMWTLISLRWQVRHDGLGLFDISTYKDDGSDQKLQNPDWKKMTQILVKTHFKPVTTNKTLDDWYVIDQHDLANYDPCKSFMT